jgi:hypothetical protein
MRKTLIFLLLTIIAVGVQAQNLYDPHRIQEVRVYFKNPSWDQELDSLKKSGKKERMLADVKLNGQMYKECGVRFKGNSSYSNARNVFGRKMPLNIKSNYSLETQTFPGGYTSLKLANGFRDPSFIREVLSYEIARKYMSAPQSNFMHVYINDEYYGLYTNVESINEKFLKDHVGNAKSVLVKCDPEYGDMSSMNKKCHKNADKATLEYMGDDSLCYEDTYEMKSEVTDYKNLIELTKRLKDNPSSVKEILDVDRALWMLAYNNVLVNLDSYTGLLVHNYYMTKDETGRWVPLIWDLNLSFGGFRHDGSGKALDNASMIKMSPFIHYRNPERPLIQQILSIPRYRKIYIAHMRTIVEENFANDWYYNRAIKLQSVVDQAVKNDESKFYSYSSFNENLTKSSKAGKTQIIGVKELMQPRTDYLQGHPLFQKTPPKITSVQHKRSGENVVVKCRVENAERVFLAYRYGKQGYFTKKTLKDDGVSDDFQAGDNFYGVEVEYKSGMQYYILAENENTAMLDPQRAEYEFHEVH